MRLLHTSDWHLGRGFHGFGLLDAQRAFVDHLVDVVRAEDIDAVLVSGDVFDRALPPVEAIELLQDALLRLSEHAQVILTSGNHDQPRRLAYGGPMFERAGVHLRTTVADLSRPVLLAARGTTAAIYGVPFLEPVTQARALATDEQPVARSHESVLAAAMRRIATDRSSRAVDRAVVMSHAWFANSAVRTDEMASASEIDVSVGGIGIAPATLVDGFDYAALGHLHRPQALDHHVRYSGSALPYSFSERAVPKQTLVVDLSAVRPAITEIPTPVHRPLVELADNLEHLLHSEVYAHAEQSFVRILLTDPELQVQPMAKLRARFPYAAELVVLATRGTMAAPDAVRSMTTVDVCDAFLAAVRNEPADEWERARINDALVAARRTDEGDDCVHADDEPEVTA